MSDNQEANVSAQQQQQPPQKQQQQQQPMQTATATTVTDGPSFAPISNRRGGPMDLDEPMQDTQPPPSQQQQQPSILFSSSGSETLQQQQQQQLQPQSQQMDGGHYDPRMLMHPLQPQISNQSTQSNQSFQSFESVDSSTASSSQQQNSGGGFSGGGSSSTPYQQQPQQYHHQQLQQPYAHPSQATTSSSLTSASGHLAPPSHEKPRSRRWSITGRFFEKRKSVTEPFHVPGSQPSSSFSSSYKSTNGNIVGVDGGGKGCSWGGPEPNFGGRDSNNGGNVNHAKNTSNQQGNQNNNSSSNTNNTSMTGSANLQSSNGGNGGSGGGEEQGGADSKNNSPPSSNGGSRRSSLADLPKAILSSFRRSSIVGPADTGSILAAASCASMAVLGAGSAGGGGYTIAEEGENPDEDVTPRITLAVPKAPPQNPHFSRPPPKSILKKRPTKADPATPAVTGGTAASSEGASESVSTTAAAAGAAAAANANSGQHAGSIDQTLISETVHPMATADMDVADINLLTPTDHRARLLTHSPTPTHPQQHLVNNIGKNPMLVGGAGSPIPSNNSDSVSSNNKVEQQSSSLSSSQPQLSQGAALPPDFTPGVQSNSSKDRGGERGQGSVGDYMSQDELLTQQMVGISSRAQDLANQYYGSNSTNNQTSTNSNLAPIASTAKRSINFRDTIEIIPAYRKSDYNRASDKHATFKILTPDMKSEIRDELNTYKMREMAVHVDSMANTAFH